jgi:hypothetical protein
LDISEIHISVVCLIPVVGVHHHERWAREGLVKRSSCRWRDGRHISPALVITLSPQGKVRAVPLNCRNGIGPLRPVFVWFSFIFSYGNLGEWRFFHVENRDDRLPAFVAIDRYQVNSLQR